MNGPVRVPAAAAVDLPPGWRDLTLAPEEIAELTERVLERGLVARDDPGRIPLASWLKMLASESVPEATVRAAVADVLASRERRLSSVLRRKADELERFFLALLPRLDVDYHTSVSVPLPSPAAARTPTPARTPAPAREWIAYAIEAEKGSLTVRATHVTRVVGSSRVDLQACKLEYSIVSPK